jgi:hypothetical protein
MSQFKHHNITHQFSIDDHETSLHHHDLFWATMAIGFTITLCLVLFLTKFFYDFYSAGHPIGNMESSRDVHFQTHRQMINYRVLRWNEVKLPPPPPPFGNYENSQRVSAGILPPCTPPPRFSVIYMPYPPNPTVIKTPKNN